jgi:hypothetical protein
MMEPAGEYFDLTARHRAVVGSLRFGYALTPEVVARDLGFELDDVSKMIADLERAGFDITPTRDR